MSSEDYGKQYSTASGFVLNITPMPPYYMDVIESIYPDKELPMRIIRNVAGDVLELPYEPEEVEKGHEDYDLWITWKSTDLFNQKQDQRRKSKREDFLLSMCVNVQEGPVDIESEDWIHRLEASFQDVNYRVPNHPGTKMLLFLKTVVITKPAEKETIMNLAVYDEVSMAGIFQAMQGFQSQMGAPVSGGSSTER